MNVSEDVGVEIRTLLLWALPLVNSVTSEREHKESFQMVVSLVSRVSWLWRYGG